MTSDDVRETAAYWQLVDILPRHDEEDVDTFLVKYIEQNPTLELTTELVNQIQMQFQHWKKTRDDPSKERFQVCKKRLEDAFHDEDDDLVDVLCTTCSSENSQGENIVSCFIQYLIDLPPNHDVALTKKCFKRLRDLKESCGHKNLVLVLKHVSKQGVSAWMKAQRLLPHHRTEIAWVLQPKKRANNYYSDSEDETDPDDEEAQSQPREWSTILTRRSKEHGSQKRPRIR